MRTTNLKRLSDSGRLGPRWVCSSFSLFVVIVLIAEATPSGCPTPAEISLSPPIPQTRTAQPGEVKTAAALTGSNRETGKGGDLIGSPPCEVEGPICHAVSYSSWSLVNPNARPAIRAAAMMAYDAADGYTVMFGGYEGYLLPQNDYAFNDSWEYRAGQWIELSPPLSPSNRSSGAMATDPSTGCPILFGGVGAGSPSTNDTWTFCHDYWTRLSTAGAPPPRYGAGFAGDPECDCMLLYGGEQLVRGQSRGPLGDTWEFANGSWANVTPSISPPELVGPSMAFDSALGAVILFGGILPNAQYSNQTWEFSGSTWTRLLPSSSPPARASGVFVSLPQGGDLLFSGAVPSQNPPGPLGDTWLFDNGRWENLTSSSSPSYRWDAAAAFDAADNCVVLFGGYNLQNPEGTYLGDTWVYGGTSIQFIEAGLPRGTQWDIDLNGTWNSSSSTAINYELGNGTYPYSVPPIFESITGSRYQPSPANDSISVENAPAQVEVTFQSQFYVNITTSSPAGGTIAPSSGWRGSGSYLTLSAVPTPGGQFLEWIGGGNGSYSGSVPSVVVWVRAPITEVALFGPVVSYDVGFAESGLPAGTTWSVLVDGAQITSDGGRDIAILVNGTYTWFAPIVSVPSSSVQYSPTPSSGTVRVNGSGVSVSMTFEKQVVSSPNGGSPWWSLTLPIPAWVALVIGGLLVAIIISLALRYRKRRRS